MRRRIIILVVMIIVAVGMSFALREPAPGPLPKVMFVDGAYVIPQQKVSLFDQWVPRRAGWGWLWKMKEAVVGRPREVNLSFTIVDLSSWTEAAATNLSLPAPALVGTNGVRAWFLTDKALAELRDGLKQKAGGEILSVARASTYDGGEARLLSGERKIVNGRPSEAGLSTDVMAHFTPQGLDITALITHSEFLTNQSAGGGESLIIRTNLTLGTRVQIGGSEGVFLLDGDPAGTDHRRIGVILAAKSLAKP